MKKSTTIRIAICETTGEIFTTRGMSKRRFHANVASRKEKGEKWRFSTTPSEKKFVREGWEQRP